MTSLRDKMGTHLSPKCVPIRRKSVLLECRKVISDVSIAITTSVKPSNQNPRLIHTLYGKCTVLLRERFAVGNGVNETVERGHEYT